MKTKLMVVASVLALLLCGAAMVAYAQGPGPEGMGHHGMGWTRARHGISGRELNLTDAQKAQVKTIMQANHANMKTVMLQLEQNRAGTSGRDRQRRVRCRRRFRRWPTSRPSCKRL